VHGEIMEVKLLKGFEITPFIEEVSKLRIKFFREFPYLYEGNMDYELEYMQGFANNENSLLCIVEVDSKVVACLTGMPLASEADILKGCEKQFEELGHLPSELFYFGEAIVLPEFRGKALTKSMHDKMLESAKANGFSKSCLATVIREKDDPRRPENYWSVYSLCRDLGYCKVPIVMPFSWPTIQPNGDTVEKMNDLKFWLKS